MSDEVGIWLFYIVLFWLWGVVNTAFGKWWMRKQYLRRGVRPMSMWWRDQYADEGKHSGA